jgi:hypothetical protein
MGREEEAMAWEVRFFANGGASGEASPGGPCPFQAEPDALTHARFLLHRAPHGRVEVFHRDTRRRAVYRLRGDRMVDLAEPP